MQDRSGCSRPRRSGPGTSAEAAPIPELNLRSSAERNRIILVRPPVHGGVIRHDARNVSQRADPRDSSGKPSSRLSNGPMGPPEQRVLGKRLKSGIPNSRSPSIKPRRDGRTMIRQHREVDRCAASPSRRCFPNPCGAIPAGAASGARPNRSPATTSSSSAAAATASRPPTTSRLFTASPTWRCWRRAGSAAAIPAATPRSSAPTTSTTRARRCTSTRSSSGRVWPRS